MNRSPLLLTAAALALGCMPAPVPPAPMDHALREHLVADSTASGALFAWDYAVATGDTLAAARLVDDQFIGQAMDGTTRTKPALLHAMSDGVLSRSGGRFVDEQIQRTGDLTIIATRAWWERFDSNVRHPGLYRTIDVFVHRPAGWRLVSEQVALVQPQQITPEDSIGVAAAVRQLFDAVRQFGQSHGSTAMTAEPSAFSAEVPNRLDGRIVESRVLSILDLPRAVYYDTTEPPVAEPFQPEQLRIQMLSPDAALATFEIHRTLMVYRRTVVFSRDNGQWRVAHVHASGVRRPTTMDMGAVCDTVPPRDSSPSQPRPVARIPAPRVLRPDVGTIVGVVTERSTGRPLETASVVFDRVVTPAIARIPGEQVQTDAAGGFSTAQLPGRYAVRARRIGYLQRVDTLTIRAGTVDTLRFALQYHSCAGY